MNKLILYEHLRKMKTLVIDDDIWIRNALTLIFESENCPMTAVETAEEGIVEVQDTDYDIVICDYMLPGMDGISFFKYIQEYFPDMKKILMTAYGNGHVMHEALNFGIHEVIEKPLSSGAIEEALTRLVVG